MYYHQTFGCACKEILLIQIEPYFQKVPNLNFVSLHGHQKVGVDKGSLQVIN